MKKMHNTIAYLNCYIQSETKEKTMQEKAYRQEQVSIGPRGATCLLRS